jgi:hypothetical protein
LILPPPSWIQLWGPFRTEVKRKHFRQFLDPEGTNGRNKTLQHSAGMSLIRLSDLIQYPLVRFVQALGQLFDDATNTRWETVP